MKKTDRDDLTPGDSGEGKSRAWIERKAFRELTDVIQAARQELQQYPSGDIPRENISALEGRLQRFEHLIGEIVEVQKARLELHLITQIALSLSSALDIEEVLNLIMDSLRQVVEYDAAGIFLISRNGKSIEGECLRGYDPHNSNLVRQKFGEGLVGWAIERKQPVIVEDVTADDRYYNARPETQSELVLPMYSGKKVIGCFNIESDRKGAFTERDIEHIETFASHAAMAIERARLHREILHKHRIDEQLALARRMQRDLLPKGAPKLALFDIAGVNLPSEEVGGDYYDYIHLTEKDLGIVVSDVSGKGVPAAFIMASLRAALRIEAFSRYALSSVLSRVNDFLNASTKPEIFVTAFYGVLDLKSKVLTYANAGHNPPLLLRTDGTRELLTEGGMLLGAFPHALYHEHRVSFKTNDLLVLYTDGATEAEDKTGEQFGIDRIEKVARETASKGPRETLRQLLRAIRRHTGREKLQDDITLVVIQCR